MADGIPQPELAPLGVGVADTATVLLACGDGELVSQAVGLGVAGYHGYVVDVLGVVFAFGDDGGSGCALGD